MRSFIQIFIILICGLLLSACSHYVVVHDTDGNPISDAEVTVQSLSTSWLQGQTDQAGKCNITSFYVQNPVNLSIRKPGYKWYYGAYPDSWPCRVSLEKE